MSPDEFIKPCGSRELLPSINQDIDVPESGHHPDWDIADDVYRKPDGEISAKVIFVISGGSVREKNYFKPLDDTMFTSARVRVAFLSKSGQGLKPIEMSDYAKGFLHSKIFVDEDSNEFHIEEGDVLYLLQDVDEFYDDLLPLFSEWNGIGNCLWLISNPCIEIWYFFHYHDDVSKLAEGLSFNVDKRSQWLKTNLHRIIKGGIKPTKDFERVKQAVENSKKNFVVDENGIPAVFSTAMHILAEDIILSMANEFDEMLYARRRHIKAFMRGK